MIKRNITTNVKTLLDIGSNLAYFCHKFEDEGYHCVAVEANPLYLYILKKLRNASNKKFDVYSDSIFKFHKKGKVSYDIILALNIFHHFLKRKRNFLKLIDLLNRVDVKEFFFGAHNPEEFKHWKYYIKFNPEQFTQFIIRV